MTIKIPIIPNPDGLEQFPTIRPEYPINILPIITPTPIEITPTPIENADIKPGVNNVIVILIIIALLYFIGGKL